MAENELLKEFGFEEEIAELAIDIDGNVQIGTTGFPQPSYRKRLILQDANLSIEEIYYWVLDYLRNEQGYPQITKICDLFSASEHSSFFGSSQQRLGLQQDKVSQFLATVGKMIKELFQLIRELRILDERLAYYEDSMNAQSKSRESAEITLKGIWIDMVEQGAKNPASVYGMARELEFTILPDLFFSVHPTSSDYVDSVVDALDFNRKVKEVLKRKLRTFMEWKKSTHKELINRRIFTLKYLRQHFDIIKMYITWVKPYLRNVRRLQMMDSTKSPDLINAFEGALIEIEILAQKLADKRSFYGKPIERNKHIYSVVLAFFVYRSSPMMNYHQEYQKGPMHAGKVDLVLRGYAWSQEKIDKYVKMKEKEDFMLLETIDASVKAAMEALGDELERYLKEAGEKINVPFQQASKQKPVDPFASVLKGMSEVFGAVIPKKSHGGYGHHDAVEIANETSAAKDESKKGVWKVYKYFKKRYNLIMW